MRLRHTICAAATAALLLYAVIIPGCTQTQKEVDKAFEISDELGKERETKVMGRDVIIHPEADKKIVIPF